MTKLDEYEVELESNVIKIDSDSVVWKLENNVMVIDDDFMDGNYTSVVSENNIYRVGFTLLGEDQCSSTTVSETLNIEYQMAEECSELTVEE